MSKAVVGAKKCKGANVKPGDNNPAVDCPCNAFLRCSTRMPYGARVWSDPEKREVAMSVISYKSAGAAVVLKYTRRGLYRELRAEADENGIRPLVLSQINDAYITAHMAGLQIGNAKEYTNFQRLMAARANLVQNGLVMRSDASGKKKKTYERLIPSGGKLKHEENEWNVDHIYSRSKGGCNRFCNAQILSRLANMRKGDKAFGCICAETEKSPSGSSADFETGGNVDKKLFQCYTLTCKAKKPPHVIPKFPPGMIKNYPPGCKICVTDDPREWSETLQKSAKAGLKAEIDKISG